MKANKPVSQTETALLRRRLSELKRQERECRKLRGMLEDLREEYQSILQSAPDAIISTNAKGEIAYWNRAAENLFGYGSGEIMGRDFAVLMAERFRPKHEAGFAKALEAGGALRPGEPLECFGVRKGGQEFPIEITHSSWNKAGAVFFAAIIRDITWRKNYEKLREDVQHMLRHDLKSPLLGIVGFAKLLLEDGSLSERQREWAGLIHESGLQMNHMLVNSQALLHMREGRYVVKPEPVDLRALLKSLAKRFEPTMRLKGVSLHLDVDQDGASMIAGEEQFLDDMLSNLIKNAVEASPEGRPVRVKVREQGQGMVIDIHNQGIIPTEIRDRFFEPYVTSGKPGGSGLGTHSAKLIAQAHQGEISFTSDEAVGTHVIVRLPLRPGSDAADGQG
jgi:PAS domain S-box-containing protein